jgi:ketosteroid isomerase-like protein
MKYQLTLLFFCASLYAAAQSNGVVEIRSYTLKPGTRDDFHRIVLEYSLPMLKRWDITVLGYGPSLQEDSSYYLVRAYPGIEARQRVEDAFYSSDEWKKGPRESIVSKILYYTTVIIPADTLFRLCDKLKAMNTATAQQTDSAALSALNHQFIDNFIRMDTLKHSTLIDPDFVCIQNDGTIMGRDEYLRGWATAYGKMGYTSFSITDEEIRIFGTTALIRAKTVFTKNIDGRHIAGNSVYTDTYVKRPEGWKCVSAQITPVAR